MSRRKLKNKIKIRLNSLLTEQLIDEIFDRKIETEFREINYDSYIAYRFKTSSDNEYDLEFHYATEPPTILLNNGQTLGDLFNSSDPIECYDISFTLSNVDNKSNPNNFELETNLNEINELFDRIAYIISIIMVKYKKIKLFIIGGDAKRNRLKIYKKIFENQFANEFSLYYGKSVGHVGESLFIIRN